MNITEILVANFPLFSKITMGTEGFSRLELDEYGFNNETTDKLRQGTKNIAILGDSFTEAFQVDREANFCSQLNQLINNDSYRVLNLGVQRKSIANYIHGSHYINKNFNPEITIIQVTENDFFLEALNPNEYIYIKRDGNSYKTTLSSNQNSFFKSFLFDLNRFSFLKSLIETSFARQSYLRAVTYKSSLKGEKSNSQLMDNEKEDLKSLIQWELSQIKKAYKNVIILFIPETPYISEDQTVIFNKDSNLKKLLSLTSKEMEIPFIDLKEDLNSYYISTHQFPHGFSNSRPGTKHLNKNGHRIAAERLYSFLMKEGYIKK